MTHCNLSIASTLPLVEYHPSECYRTSVLQNQSFEDRNEWPRLGYAETYLEPFPPIEPKKTREREQKARLPGSVNGFLTDWTVQKTVLPPEKRVHVKSPCPCPFPCPLTTFTISGLTSRAWAREGILPLF